MSELRGIYDDCLAEIPNLGVRDLRRRIEGVMGRVEQAARFIGFAREENHPLCGAIIQGLDDRIRELCDVVGQYAVAYERKLHPERN